MDEVLDDCLADHPILGHKVQGYMKDVVHKGCTHEGRLINSGLFLINDSFKDN